ncbi:hypothetical protein [Treponema sp. OMZ 788]|uniref:hypothetical protein n=1 Tax=Treponema sp. OMZ 788 TaxID=2563664 RepID=UPI0020A52321|nr:hypothetical protein [Treponema sp. OMZ 788]
MDYRLNRIEILSGEVYERIKERLAFKKGKYVKIKELYERYEDGYKIKNDVEEESVLGIIEALIDVRKEGKIYIKESISSGERRLREICIFTEEEAEKIGKEYFERIEADYELRYQIKRDISEEEKEKLIKSLKIYEGYKYDFAYFEYDGLKKEYKTKRENLAKEEVKNFLEYLESYYYEKVELIIEYPSSSLYPVKNGEIEVAKIKDGQFVIEYEEIKKYEGNENYESGIYESEKGLEKISRYERLYGGANLWYYGLYSRYGEQKFSENKLFEVNEYEGKSEEDVKKERDRVKGEIDAEKNKNEDSSEKDIKNEVNKKISEGKLGGYIPIETYHAFRDKSGQAPEVENNSDFTFSDKSLLGSVSVHVNNGFDREGKIKSEVNHYASYIDDNIIYASRITGAAYKALPWVQEAGGVSFALSKTVSESFDRNIGASAGNVNVSVGYNSGTSGQTQGYQDINGDGYPDILKTENGNLYVQDGQENLHFSNERRLMGAGLSSNTNSSKVFGTGVGLSGSLNTIMDSKAKIKSVTVAPSGDTSCSVSGNAGINYSKGSQSQEGGLIDVNGDGLPDYQNKGDTSLNLGDEFKRAGRWKNGLISSGRVESGGGSIGGGLNATYSIFSGGVSFGLSANISRTTTEEILTDLNGDGLPDKLSTGENGNYKIRINTGRGFSAEEKTVTIGTFQVNEYADFF